MNIGNDNATTIHFGFDSTSNTTPGLSPDDIYSCFRKDEDLEDMEVNLEQAFILYSSANKTTDLERLQRFRELRESADSSKQSCFELCIDERQDEWSYEFLMDGNSLYKSETMAIGHGQDLILFKNEVLLRNILLAAALDHQTITASDMAKLNDIAGQAILPYQESVLAVVKTFESMAKIIATAAHKAFIKLEESRFWLGFGGSLLDCDEIPLSTLGTGLTPRVQITMSALRVALIPIERLYLGRTTPLLQDIEAGPELQVEPGRSIASISMLTSESSNECLQASGVQSCQTSWEELKPLVELACAGIYIEGGVAQMSKNESFALHAQMHKTRVGEFTLGELLNVPKPTDSQIAQALGNYVWNF